MSDDRGDLILEYMRRFERTLGEMRADLHYLRQDVSDFGRRVTNVEEQLVRVNRRLDRMDERIARIGCRLDLVEG